MIFTSTTVRSFRLFSPWVVLLSLLQINCAGEPDEATPVEADADEAELINGTVAGPNDFRPTLLIQNACTAVKVGPRRILTAAHCVSNQLASGQKLMFHTDNAINDSNALALAKFATVESVRIHPNYDPTKNLIDAPDVAVIVVKSGSPLDLLPSAQVDLNPVALSTKVIINGYGCRQVMLGGGTGEHTLSSASATTVDPTTLKLPFSAQQLDKIDDNFVATPGPAQVDGAAGVCPGDSGGPVFRVGASKLTVVAVNSWTSGSSTKGPRANLLARLHEGSRHSVGEWLSQQGVRLNRPCKDTKRCTGAIPKPLLQRAADPPGRQGDAGQGHLAQKPTERSPWFRSSPVSQTPLGPQSLLLQQ